MAKQQAVTKVNLHVASLNFLQMPTQWTHGEGRSKRIMITESVRMIFRGSRVGMLRKINSSVLETRYGDALGTSTAAHKETKTRGAVAGVGGVHSTA
jgi:hypothetical protein